MAVATSKALPLISSSPAMANFSGLEYAFSLVSTDVSQTVEHLNKGDLDVSANSEMVIDILSRITTEDYIDAVYLLYTLRIEIFHQLLQVPDIVAFFTENIFHLLSLKDSLVGLAHTGRFPAKALVGRLTVIENRVLSET